MATTPYDDLPVGIRRANLQAARQSLLSDRHAQELHARRLALFAAGDDARTAEVTAARDRLLLFDKAIGELDDDLAALPADGAPST